MSIELHEQAGPPRMPKQKWKLKPNKREQGKSHLVPGAVANMSLVSRDGCEAGDVAFAGEEDVAAAFGVATLPDAGPRLLVSAMVPVLVEKYWQSNSCR